MLSVLGGTKSCIDAKVKDRGEAGRLPVRIWLAALGREKLCALEIGNYGETTYESDLRAFSTF
jgi:hypothetical protein